MVVGPNGVIMFDLSLKVVGGNKNVIKITFTAKATRNLKRGKSENELWKTVFVSLQPL
jgi:hypothetical protein